MLFAKEDTSHCGNADGEHLYSLVDEGHPVNN